MEKLHAHKITQLKVVQPDKAARDYALAALKPYSKTVANLSTVNPDEAFMQQPDLLYVEAVLVTEGINDNDDAFTHEELWKAQASPILKPINLGHNDASIVGAIYGVTARKLDGTSMTEDDGSPFELVMHGVVWHYLPHLQSVAQQINESFEAGECYVSMECWFEGYDYGLYNNDSLDDVINRCDATAHLEQHLRVRGGSGKFNNIRIGRALRDITFGGVAFVKVPANKRSDVLNVFTFDPDKLEYDDATVVAHNNNNVVRLREGSMNDITKTVAHVENADVRKEVAQGIQDALTNDRERAQAEAQANELKQARTKAADLEKQLEDAQAALTRAHEAVETGYQEVRAQAGATGDTPEEIARIDRASDGDDAFRAKIAFIAQTGGRAQAKVADEMKQLREENAKLEAQVREHTRAGEIRELFDGILAEDEVDGLVKAGLAKSDEDYAAWLEEHKLTTAKMHEMMKGKEGKDEKKDDKKKGKGRLMMPADETEKLADDGSKLNARHGRVPSSVPSKQSLASVIEENFDEVEDDLNLEGADAGAAEEAEDVNPFDKVIAGLYTKPRQDRKDRLLNRAQGAVQNNGGN